MSLASHYWTLIRLDPSQGYKTEPLSNVRAFFLQQFSNTVDGHSEVIDTTVQSRLLELCRANNTSSVLAELCLRCFISRQILIACQSLVRQFGERHHFTIFDILPIVLTDDGKIAESFSQSVAHSILSKFRSDRGNLAAWTIRLVKDNRELGEFLLQQGVLRATDWGLLNSIQLEQLRRILKNYYRLRDAEIEQAYDLLESYKAVYVVDRAKQASKGRCLPPTQKQLERISHLIQQKTQQPISPNAVLTRLRQLADRLREYSIVARGGSLPTQSIDAVGGSHQFDEQRADTYERDERNQQAEREQMEFLEAYQQEFMQGLDLALQQVVRDRLNAYTTQEQCERYITVLKLFHCEQMSMSAISAQTGVLAPVHLLRLRAFRADVRRLLIKHLKPFVLGQARNYRSPEQLQQLDQQLADLLGEQVDRLIEEEAKRTKTPKKYAGKSVFSERLCNYLDRFLQEEADE